MKTKIFIIACFLGMAQLSLGQYVSVKERTSGYMGKRFVVGAKMHFSPSIEPQTPDDTYNLLTLNKDWYGSIEYVVKNNGSLGLLFGTSNTSMDLDFYGYQGLSVGDERFELEDMNGRPAISDRQMGLTYTWTLRSKAGLAPLGNYFRMGLVMHNYTVGLEDVTYDLEGDYSTDYARFVRDFSGEETKMRSPELRMGVGQTVALAGPVMFDYGLQFGYLFSHLKYAAGQYNNRGTDDIFYPMKTVLFNRLARRQIINLHIGVKVAL